MNKSARALIELQAWADANKGWLNITYHNNILYTTTAGINYHWHVCIGKGGNKYYGGYGATQDEAVLRCYQDWQQS
jgi:hypothetical protein